MARSNLKLEEGWAKLIREVYEGASHRDSAADQMA